MRKLHLKWRLAAALLLLQGAVHAQTNAWLDVAESSIRAEAGQRKIIPNVYRTVALDTAVLLNALRNAPKEFTPAGRSNPVIIALPLPGGGLQRFKVVQSIMMEPGLSAKVPTIKTWAGQGIDDPFATLKLDWTAFGFHAMVLSPNSSPLFIDPYAQGGLLHYISYYKKDLTPKAPLVEVEPVGEAGLKNISGPEVELAGACVAGTLRTYRLAVACTGEYARAVGGATVTQAQALSAIVTTVNRVNGVYEKELAVRLVLVADNIRIVYTDPATDVFAGNNNASTLITESQKVTTDSIGTANFDIGHTFSTGGGGLAGLGVVCRSTQKGRGITGSSNPVGDPYDIDYVAHEMGHQFGGNHTFNATTGSCGGNGSTSANAEPGSGSTIMAYAGICLAANNLQPNSDPQFHPVSFFEIVNYITTGSGNGCPVLTATGNVAPTVNAGLDYTIPKSTPFVLNGTATDPDSDALTYSWEQVNTGGTFGNWNAPVGNAPAFRSFQPVTTGERYFPKLSSLVSNTNVIGELLPSYARTMTFRLTARDNRSGGGGVCYDEASVAVNAAAGPFTVLEPNTAVIWQVGEFRTITWDVANTTAAPVSCANVILELSTDGGFTYPVVLLASTPNDGNEEILVPDNVTTTARVRVRAAGNIFFDISNTNFTIQASSQTTFVLNNPPDVTSCTGVNAAATVKTNALGGYAAPVTLSATGAPAGTTVVFGANPIPATGSTTLTLQGTAAPGAYTVNLTATSGSIVRTRAINFAVGAPLAPVKIAPADNAVSVALKPAFSWQPSVGAQTYLLEISLNPAFSTTVQSIAGIPASFYTLTTELAPNTEYYWRVTPANSCGAGTASTGALFKTLQVICNADTSYSTNVPITIPTTVSTINSSLIIGTGGTVADVNVVGLRGTHTYVSDLTATLISPAGTTVTLFTGVCGSQDNFDINFDDEAASATITCPPTGGQVRRPVQALSLVDGESMTGTWTMRIADGFADDGGSLNNWGLRFCLTGTSTLPVQGWQFSGRKNGDQTVTLQWLTENETHNDHYEIERSSDGVHFVSIGEVKAGRNPLAVQQYVYNDVKPAAGANYYRLKQVDIDGKFSWSAVVIIRFDKGGALWMVYPNPVKDKGILRVLDDAKHLEIRLVDALGKTVYQKSLGAVKAGQQVELPVQGFSRGLYVLAVQSENGSTNEKLVLQ